MQPSSLCIGAFSHRSTYSSTQRHCVCVRSAFEKQLMRNRIEECLDVDVEHPVVAQHRWRAVRTASIAERPGR